MNLSGSRSGPGSPHGPPAWIRPNAYRDRARCPHPQLSHMRIFRSNCRISSMHSYMPSSHVSAWPWGRARGRKWPGRTGSCGAARSLGRLPCRRRRPGWRLMCNNNYLCHITRAGCTCWRSCRRARAGTRAEACARTCAYVHLHASHVLARACARRCSMNRARIMQRVAGLLALAGGCAAAAAAAARGVPPHAARVRLQAYKCSHRSRATPSISHHSYFLHASRTVFNIACRVSHTTSYTQACGVWASPARVRRARSMLQRAAMLPTTAAAAAPETERHRNREAE